MYVELVSMTRHPLDTIAKVVTNCYDSKPSKKVVEECYKSGHTSPFEFVNFHFHIAGVSRVLLAQLTRHRIASYCVRSQRYVNESGFEYFTPKTIATDPGAKVCYDAVIRQIQMYYDKLVNDYGIPKEDTRYILPNACKTELDMSINLRSLMNLCNERLCAKAQAEIRELTSEMVAAILKEEPELRPYLVPKCEKTDPPVCPERKPCGRHNHVEEKTPEAKMKFLVIGRSGSGKDTLVDEFCKRHGTTKVISYTTRPRRKGESENKHIFITKEKMQDLKDSGELCAYTVFDGYEYGATVSQLKENDFYIIDPDGLEYFQKQWYNHQVPFYTIGIETAAENIGIRMANRGDQKNTILQRMTHDFVIYGNLENLVQAVVVNDSFEEAYANFEKVVLDAQQYHATELDVVYDDGGMYDARTGRPLKGECKKNGQND